MESLPHSDLEELRRKAKRAKEFKRWMESTDTVKPTDTMVILHEEDINLLDDLLCGVLTSSEFSTHYKRRVLEILNHIRGEE
jgi:hypothetical protein